MTSQKKSERLKILVTGLLPQQANLIEKEFGNEFNLRFWKDKGLASLKHSVTACDIALLIVNKASHKTSDILKANCKNYNLVTGGLTSLRTKLKELSQED